MVYYDIDFLGKIPEVKKRIIKKYIEYKENSLIKETFKDYADIDAKVLVSITGKENVNIDIQSMNGKTKIGFTTTYTEILSFFILKLI